MKLLLLLLFFIAKCGSDVSNKNCKACPMIPNQHGDRSGYNCYYQDETAVRFKLNSTKNLLPNCVPNDFELTREIVKYCCFWSPELGCSVLLGESIRDDYNIACQSCREFCIVSLQKEQISSNNSNSGYNALKIQSVLFSLFTLTICILKFNVC